MLRTGRWDGELIHTRQDGTQVTAASRWSLQRDDRGQPVAILETNNDITARKRADAELQRSEQRYRNIFQTTGVSIWEEDFSQVKAAIDVLKAEGVGDFRQYLAEHPEFVQQAIAMVKVIDVNDATVELFGARSKDELLVSLHKVFRMETHDVFAGELIAIAEGQRSFESEVVLQTLKGDKLDVLFTMTLPLELDKFDSVLVSIIDITARKQAQEALQQAQAQLAHVSRVTTLGELAASIAHEVNQPLAAVGANADAALRWLAAQPPRPRGGPAGSQPYRQGRPSRRRDHQACSRPGQKGAAAEGAAEHQRSHPRGHRPDARRGAGRTGSCCRRGSPAICRSFREIEIQLQQVILNLIVNAVEAMSGDPEGGGSC